MATSFRLQRYLGSFGWTSVSYDWSIAETIPEVFAPPWLFELAKPLFQSEAECEAIDMEMIFYSHTNKTHFHKKGFALSLVLKVRIFGTRK